MVRPQPILPVFREHGLDAMVRTYRANLSLRPYRWKHRLWQGATGVRFLHFLDEINMGVSDIGPMTMAKSAWKTLERMGFPFSVDWQVDPASIRGRSVIFYAGHPSYIEPLVCLAALRDFDPKIVATAWLQRISPSVAQRIIGIPDAKEAVSRQVREYRGVRRILETCWARLLTFTVIKHLQGDMSIDEHTQRRREAVMDIVATLGRRQPVLLFPAGGEGQKPWVRDQISEFSKFLRFVIARQKKVPALQQLVFVPLLIRGSVRALFRSRIMARWHPLPALFRLLPDRDFRITVGEGLALGELREFTNDADRMAERLMRLLAA